MKIKSISLNNFRQYYGINSINLETNPQQNLVLVGGQNGYGKTNLLISLVWCLYGENISKVDEKFKFAIQKEGNYPKFLKNSLNLDALKEGITKFSVEIEINGIELPDTLSFNSEVLYDCKIIRTFDINSAEDELLIDINGIDKNLFYDIDEKNSFINDYLIPIDAAKFIFFDAEKISQIAGLSDKEEANVMNDALSKILGLDIYESLEEDLQIYCDSLKRDSADSTLKDKIITNENQIKLNLNQIKQCEEELLGIEIKIEKLKKEKKKIDKYLSSSNNINVSQKLEELLNQKEVLLLKSQLLENTFNDLSEIIPFAIAAGKIEEVIEHLAIQEEYKRQLEEVKAIEQKSVSFMEELFNKAPFPIDDISIKTKLFYLEKGEEIFKKAFSGDDDIITEPKFEHDLNKSDKELIIDTYNYVKSQSKDVFEQSIEHFISVRNEIQELDRSIRKLQLINQDEELSVHFDNRDDIERRVDKLIEEKGIWLNKIETIKKQNENFNTQIQFVLKKIGVSELKKNKIKIANEYIKVLEQFIGEQKRIKCIELEKLIYSEMTQIMHKFTDANTSNFISKVKVEILPPNDGLKVILFDSEGNIKQKESLLSEGEKQIYISSLIKAILTLSTQDLPIIIDTPLARLDSKHIKNFLQFYYPNLGKQVVLLATDNEIPQTRLKLIEEKVAHKYLLVNKDNRTSFKKGYFYEN